MFDSDFGVAGIIADGSTDETPTYLFPGPGTYTTTLIAGSTSTCKDTTTATCAINEPLIVDFTSQDSLCITGNSFDFDGTISKNSLAKNQWNFFWSLITTQMVLVKQP